jgi:hypothetical protein
MINGAQPAHLRHCIGRQPICPICQDCSTPLIIVAHNDLESSASNCPLYKFPFIYKNFPIGCASESRPTIIFDNLLVSADFQPNSLRVVLGGDALRISCVLAAALLCRIRIPEKQCRLCGAPTRKIAFHSNRLFSSRPLHSFFISSP